MPKYTQRELEVLVTFGEFIKRLNTSKNQSIGTCIERLAADMFDLIIFSF